MADWLAHVDLYCERTAPGFWNEPVNALSNIAFPLAALWAAVEARRRGRGGPVLWVLIVLAALIGVGSFLFHVYANAWSELADVLPIWSFVALYVLTAMRLLGGAPPGRIAVIGAVVALALVVVFLATGDSAETVAPDPLNGSGQYAPALIALLAFAGLSWRRGAPFRLWAMAAAGLFLLSLAFRTLDMAVCPGWPLGVHFLWHVLNAAMVGVLLQILIRFGGWRERNTMA